MEGHNFKSAESGSSGVRSIGSGDGVQSIWTPQPGPQTFAVMCPADIVFFGGSRGGGKTDCAIGKQIIGAMNYGYNWNGLFLRKNFKHFNDLRRRVDNLIMEGLPAERVGGDHQTNTIKFKNGARVLLTAIERSEQLDFFQGNQFQSICIEEACQFPFIDEMIDKLKGCLRSAAGVPCQMFLTGNPGGPGHSMVRNRFITPAPGGGVSLQDGEDTAMFIPSNVVDNVILCQNDPKYVGRLRSIRDESLRRAWLEGDWDVVLGGFFDDVWDQQRNVLPKFRPPRHWPRMCGMDWGTARPFSVGWFAVADGESVPGLSVKLPRGAIVMYDEWYGCVKGEINTGLRLTSSQVAAGILEREKARGEDLLIFDRVADTSIFDEDDGPSIGERFAQAGVVWRKSDKRRIPGWENMRNMLRGVAEEDAEGRKSYTPMFYVTDNCKYMIDLLPTMQRDENNWDDMDSDGPDHALDMARYTLMARPSAGITKEEHLEERRSSLYDCKSDWEEIVERPAVEDWGFNEEMDYLPLQ